MGQINGPARLLDELLGQIGGAATGFDRREHPRAGRDHFHNLLPVVLTRRIHQQLARRIQSTHLNRILVIVQSYKNG